MTAWGDVITRARGLEAHLLGHGGLVPLCAATSVPDLAAQLASLRLIPSPTTGHPNDERAIELALRRRAGASLRILSRWAGDRRERLAPLFDDEDRRALRFLLRGVVAGIAPEARIAGLVPTPTLPMRALELLAHAGDVATIATQLLAWRHPFGADLASEAMRQRPDLLQLEMTLVRTYAKRAVQAARVGDGAMRHFVERTIDAENLWAALVIADQRTDVEPAAVFAAGGRIVTLDDLLAAAELKSPAEVTARLMRRVHGTALAAALSDGPRSADDGLLEALVTEFRRLALRDPVGTAPVILFVLHQRAELRALQRILWSVSLGVPRAAVERSAGLAA